MQRNKIKVLREALGLSQEAFAAALGVHRITVISWEVGRNDPSPMALKLMRRLAKRRGVVFGVDDGM